jgi:hypothetical protein
MKLLVLASLWLSRKALSSFVLIDSHEGSTFFDGWLFNEDAKEYDGNN